MAKKKSDEIIPILLGLALLSGLALAKPSEPPVIPPEIDITIGGFNVNEV